MGPGAAWPGAAEAGPVGRSRERRPPCPTDSFAVAAAAAATSKAAVRDQVNPPYAGRITRQRMLLLADQLHEAALLAWTQRGAELSLVDADPAWEEDDQPLSPKYAARARQWILWQGGRLGQALLGRPSRLSTLR